MDDAVEMDSMGRGAPGVEFTRARHGKREVEEYYANLDQTYTMVSFEVTEYIAQGDRIVALIDSEWRPKDRDQPVFRVQKADVLEFRDGKIVRFFDYFDTAAVPTAATG
ncbi:ketosteroid isomerase-like protein [Caulobacter ginsengisoli]|uniref:Ketosteroid isomerase-like protein n=1 Tax=Caulobacter ginsengisoli TaxID=400775 RepID=A0ABU0IWU7_9CAUL|nr:nuclear transport factor 2 family protein [Caulobacter ginsengisoli]MDQ0465840.1 ketosteroid isomerase-like protein [Caulobacter ginsengisoli]